MQPIGAGTQAPAIPGAPAGTRLVVFYKTTCPVCQMAAPTWHSLAEAHPGSVYSVGQDPKPVLDEFAAEHGSEGVPGRSDLAPYDLSNAYGVRVVPTLFLIDDTGAIKDFTESWDRDAFNRVSQGLSDLTGSSAVVTSEPGDGLPPFRPG